jgi:predicted CXXCH cytochrome family protein
VRDSSREFEALAPRANPNRRWVCGYTGIGAACHFGPDENGKCCFRVQSPSGEVLAADSSQSESACSQGCSAEVQCQLASQCATLGHSCDAIVRNLGPCVPVRASWFSRRNLALNAALLVGGILLLLMTLPQREAVFVPGGLSSKHSQILGNTLVADRCSTCHSSAHSDAPAALRQDDLCMTCHEATMPDASLRQPHDLQLAQLRTLATPSDAVVHLVSSKIASEPRTWAKTTCAECHIEHRGSSHDLKAITNRRCQSCHEKQFKSFADGHPDFVDYPYRTSFSIAFDHQAHAAEYFAKKGQPFECQSCHLDVSETGSVGSIFRSVGFKEACASCHDEPIRSEMTNGWALLQMPCIDPADRGSGDGSLSGWPDNASFGYDGHVSVAMRLLLAADPQARIGLEGLPETNKIADVPRSEQSRVAKSLAVGFRNLVLDVSRHGQLAWQRRLTQVAIEVLGRELNQAEYELVYQACRGLPPDLFRQIELRWLSQDATIAASSQLHERIGNRVKVTLAAAPFQDELLEDDAWKTELASEDSLLEGSGLEDDLQLTGKPSSADSAESVLESGIGKVEEDGRSVGGLQKSVYAPLTRLEGSEHVAHGGWYLDSEILSLNYMPLGHADPVLTAWTQLVALFQDHRSRSESHPAIDDALQIGSLVPGSCTECHLLAGHVSATVTESAARLGDRTIWQSLRKPESLSLFTKFDHTPHLSLPTVSDCAYCHQLQSAAPSETVAGYAQSTEVGQSFDSLRQLLELPASPAGGKLVNSFSQIQLSMRSCLQAEFKHMEKSQCTACHRPNSANDGCTQCHNYHVGDRAFQWSHPTESRNLSKSRSPH